MGFLEFFSHCMGLGYIKGRGERAGGGGLEEGGLNY